MTPDYLVVTSRTVVLRPRFEGVALDGISWQVEIGTDGKIMGINGTWADVRSLGNAPLRSVRAVFADLAAGRGIDPEPVPVAATEPGDAVPFHEIAPISVAIDHVTLGYSVMAATDDGHAVVDIVPTYVFAGRTSTGADVSRTLVAVSASVGSRPTAPNPSNPSTEVPGVIPPIGTPEPQPAPAPSPPTVSGPPIT